MSYATNWNQPFSGMILPDETQAKRVTTPTGDYAWEVFGLHGDAAQRLSRDLRWDADPDLTGGARTEEWTQQHQFPSAKAAHDAWETWFERATPLRRRARP